MRTIKTIHIKSGLKETNLKCKGQIRSKQGQLKPLYSIDNIRDFLRPELKAKLDHTGPNRTKQDKP